MVEELGSAKAATSGSWAPRLLGPQDPQITGPKRVPIRRRGLRGSPLRTLCPGSTEVYLQRRRWFPHLLSQMTKQAQRGQIGYLKSPAGGAGT